MRKNIFTGLLIYTAIGTAGSSAIAFDETEIIRDCIVKQPLCLTSIPTLIPMFTLVNITGGAVEISLAGKANEAIAAAQEPAFLILNNQNKEVHNPLFVNAVLELKKQNPQISEISDLEMAAIILRIGEQTH